MLFIADFRMQYQGLKIKWHNGFTNEGESDKFSIMLKKIDMIQQALWTLTKIL